MKPAARDAGKRRRLLQAGCGLIASYCAGCTGNVGPRSPTLLEPRFSIAGARLVTRMDAVGGTTPDAIGRYIPFVFPVAIAIAFNDLYIADAGLGRLFRYDRALDAMAIMPEVRITLGTRLQTGPDGSIYVLDPQTSGIRRYTRGGQLLSQLRGRLPTSRYTDFTVAPVSGRIFAVDSSYRMVDEMHPLGFVALEMQQLEESGPITTDGRGIFVGSTTCGCIREWIQGRAGRFFGAGHLKRPHAIALLDGKRLFAIDGFDRGVGYVHEEGVETMLPHALGMVAPEGIAADRGLIYIADGAGQRITAFAYQRGLES